MSWKSVSWRMWIASFFSRSQFHSALTRHRNIFSSTQPAPHLLSANNLTPYLIQKQNGSCQLWAASFPSPFPSHARHLPLFQPQRYVSESGPVFSPLGLGSLTYILPLIIGGWLHRGKNPGYGARPARWEYSFLLSKGVTMGTLLNGFVLQFFLLKNGINNRAYLIVLWACHELRHTKGLEQYLAPVLNEC